MKDLTYALWMVVLILLVSVILTYFIAGTAFLLGIQ